MGVCAVGRAPVSRQETRATDPNNRNHDYPPTTHFIDRKACKWVQEGRQS